MLLSVVIPTYQRTDTLLGLLADLQGQAGVSFEIIVVDDCSPDDPRPELQRRFPSVSVLRQAANSGPAVTRNRGIRAARGEIVVGFDNDVRVPDPTTLARIAATFARRPDVDGLALRLLGPDGHADDDARWWHPVPLREFADRPFLTSYFSGTGYAFRRGALLGTPLFPGILFMHYEEVELAYRLIDRGSLILYCPDIAVRHCAHPVSRRSEIKVFYKPRNQVLLAIGCLPLRRALQFLLPRLVFQFWVAVRDRHLGSYLRALGSAAGKFPERWRERRVLSAATFIRLAQLRAGVAAAAPEL